MDDTAPAPEGLPPSLRFLKFLVIVLTLTMIVGVISIVAVIVNRMPKAIQGLPRMPDAWLLPDGTRATAFTQGPDWYAVVIEGDEILIFDRATGALRQRVKVERGSTLIRTGQIRQGKGRLARPRSAFPTPGTAKRTDTPTPTPRQHEAERRGRR